MMKKRDIDFIGSLGDQTARQAAAVKSRGIDQRFASQFFILRPETKTLQCPAGKQLTYVKQKTVRGDPYHRYRAAGSDCSSCEYQPKCCPERPEKGRAVALRVEDGNGRSKGHLSAARRSGGVSQRLEQRKDRVEKVLTASQK
jgi:hypothetical protein